LELSIVALKEEKTTLGVKQEVIKMIQSLPDEVTIDEISTPIVSRFGSQVTCIIQ